MKSAAPLRIDPLSLGGLVVVGALLTAFAASSTLPRTARLVLEAAWLYVSNTRG